MGSVAPKHSLALGDGGSDSKTADGRPRSGFTTGYWLAVASLLAVLLAIASWNSYKVDADTGYDHGAHYTYAKDLAYSGQIPPESQTAEYYTPPLFYAVFGGVMRFADHFGASRPDKVARTLNVPLLLGTAVLVLLLARMLWPERRRLQLAALAFFVFLPVTMKLAAMFHPELLSLFLSTLALTVAVHVLVHDDYRRRTAVVLGVALGAAQLTRAFTLWTFFTVVAVLVVAAYVRVADRRRILVATGIAVAATAVVTAPWYIRQAIHYSNPVFNRPTVQAPLWRRRPVSFYTALGLPQSLNDPVRPNFVNDAIPTVYDDVWGDYFGGYEWGAGGPIPPATHRQLVDQSYIGLVPTAFALAGLIGLLVASLRRRVLHDRPAQLLVPLLALAGVAGFLYFTVSYPTPDGDVLKASYMLTTAPAWALCFGWTFAALTRDRLVRWGVVLFLATCAITDLGFLLFNTSLTGWA
jgi:4-amino-4-deoxy-L-arabinose transferase-like glycosyltransferase